MTVRLVRAVVGLALTSVVLSIIMFRLNATLAAVFELSVCAGLISVIFITTVSFTQRLTPERLKTRRKERFTKFWLLPFIVIIAAVILYYNTEPVAIIPPVTVQDEDVRLVLWNKRHLDLLGQVVLLLAAAIGVVVLFKEQKK
jgi:NADH-quinone oxidoreductase subunit J